MPSRKATRPDDKRTSAMRPRKTAPKPPSRYQQLMNGTLKVEDLDDDEIMAGRCKDSGGFFRGRPPDKFPRQLHDAMRKEFQERIALKFQEGVEIGYDTLKEVAQSRHSAAQARVAAAIHLIERGAGKVPDKVGVEVTVKKFEEDVDSLLVDVPDEDNVFVITTAQKEQTA